MQQIADGIVGVRVIHHHVERLALVNLLEAAWDGFQLADAGFDSRDRNIEGERGADCREDVVNVYAADERRTYFDIAGRSLRNEFESVEAGREFFRRDLRRDRLGHRSSCAVRLLLISSCRRFP